MTAVTAATVLSTAAAAGATGTTAAMEAVCKMAADQCLTKVNASILVMLCILPVFRSYKRDLIKNL